MLQSDRKPSFHDAGSKGMAGYSEDSQMTLDSVFSQLLALVKIGLKDYLCEIKMS